MPFQTKLKSVNTTASNPVNIVYYTRIKRPLLASFFYCRKKFLTVISVTFFKKTIISITLRSFLFMSYSHTSSTGNTNYRFAQCEFIHKKWPIEGAIRAKNVPCVVAIIFPSNLCFKTNPNMKLGIKRKTCVCRYLSGSTLRKYKFPYEVVTIKSKYKIK